MGSLRFSILITFQADLIIARIMEYGIWAAMLWLQRVYSKERLREFLESRGKNILPPRELNYWALICEVPLEKRQQWLQQIKETADVWQTRSTH